MTDPDELMARAEQESREVREHALRAVHYFIENEGTVYTFQEAVEAVVEELGMERELASRIVTHLASDDVDPVVHVSARGERHILVSDYVEGEWWYGYEDYDDVKHRGRKVVCCQCVSEGKHPSEVGKVFENDVSDEFDGYGDLSEWLFEHHFQNRHQDVDPSGVGVHIGASLASGTTIASNTAWHDGNVSRSTNIGGSGQTLSVSPQGSGSGLDADTVDGSHASDLGSAGSIGVSQIGISTTNVNLQDPSFSITAATRPDWTGPGTYSFMAGARLYVTAQGGTASMKLRVGGNTIGTVTTSDTGGNGPFTETWSLTSITSNSLIEAVGHIVNQTNVDMKVQLFGLR